MPTWISLINQFVHTVWRGLGKGVGCGDRYFSQLQVIRVYDNLVKDPSNNKSI